MNKHHLYYPSNEYTTPLEKAFRELPMNKVLLCTYEHNMIHHTEAPPNKPSRPEMIRSVYQPEL